MDHLDYVKSFRYQIAKNVNTYKILYSDVHHDKDGWVEEFPKNDSVKKKLQEAIVQANEMNWRFTAKKKVPSNINNPKPKKTRNEKGEKIDDRFADKSKKRTVLLASILEEQNQNVTSDESSNVIILRSLHSAKGNDIKSDSNSDRQFSISSSSDGEMDDCDLGRSAYVPNLKQSNC